MRYGRWGKGYRTQGRRGTAKDALSVFFLSFYLNGLHLQYLPFPPPAICTLQNLPLPPAPVRIKATKSG